MAFEYDPPSVLSHFEPADLLDALSIGVVVLDAQLCIIYANDVAQDALAFRVDRSCLIDHAEAGHGFASLCQ